MQSRSNLPVILEPLSPLWNFSLGIEQEVRLWRIRFGSQCINRGKSVWPQAISPMLDLAVVSACSSCLIVIDDQAASRRRQFT
jgi:hypothetical protein